MLNLSNNRKLDEHNWSGYVIPGTTVVMSFLVRRRAENSTSHEVRCPESTCAGRWAKVDAQFWVTW